MVGIRGVALSVVARAARLAFNPASLFAASEPGVWLDPSDFSTMFQDSAGTTPVTAVGQPVGRILDKSGRGNHATQTTSTSRPVLQQDGNGKYYLRFDGVDDWLITPTITPGVDKAQVFAGVRKLSDAAYQPITELGTNPDATIQSFTLGASTVTGDASRRTWAFGSRGSASIALAGGAVYTAPITNVLAGIGNISGDSVILRVNGTQAASSTSDQGAGNYGNHPLYIGRRGGTTQPFSGHLYGLVVRFGANLPAGTIASTETWLNGKTGAY